MPVKIIGITSAQVRLRQELKVLGEGTGLSWPLLQSLTIPILERLGLFSARFDVINCL